MGAPVDLLAHEPPNAKWEDGFRPVDVDFDECGRLIVTSDGSGSVGSKVVRIEWMGPACEEPSAAPTADVTTKFPTAASSSQPTTENSSASPISNPHQSPVPSKSPVDVSHSPSCAPSTSPTSISGGFCLRGKSNALFSQCLFAALLYSVAECF